MSNGRGITILLIAGLTKRFYKMSSQYFPSYEVSKCNNIKFVLDLSG